jgi:hypothetical protein
VTHVVALDDVGPTLDALAGVIGVAAPGWSGPPARRAERRAFVPIWRRPWMTINADTYGSSLLAALGTDNVYADAPERYPTVTLDDAAAQSPDLVLLPSEPYPFAERHVAEIRSVAEDVRLVDGRDLFWWGVRTPAALQRLATALA